MDKYIFIMEFCSLLKFVLNWFFAVHVFLLFLNNLKILLLTINRTNYAEKDRRFLS